ncbi:hypothetical protein ACFV9D_21310 [Streptomyces sp. NPDC059875]|uniref:hypothetical protein n=1 Tax=unclassified Streptomyces TaxID=2593676 RepID=UPI0036486076
MTGGGRSRTLLWTGVGAGLAGIVALVVVAVVDLGKADQIASVVGVVLAAAGLGLSLWSRSAGASAVGSSCAVTASGERSVAAGGNIGSVTTGNGAQVPTPPAPPAPTTPTPTPPAPAMPSVPSTGSVTASGDRSVAAGGDIGSVSTGDA